MGCLLTNPKTEFPFLICAFQIPLYLKSTSTKKMKDELSLRSLYIERLNGEIENLQNEGVVSLFVMICYPYLTKNNSIPPYLINKLSQGRRPFLG